MSKVRYIFFALVIFCIILRCYRSQSSKLVVIETYRFDEPLIDSVKIGYALPTFAKSSWRIVGYTDDTIIFKYLKETKLEPRTPYFKHYLSGKIDFSGFEDGASFDWNYIIIEPYKAKKGFIRAERRIEP